MVEKMEEMITRNVMVNRSCTPEEMLKATGRKLYLNNEVVTLMPRHQSDREEIFFFKLGFSASDEYVEGMYKFLRLEPANLYEIAAVNEADPAFADYHPNVTHWRENESGKWCYAAFAQQHNERHVSVNHRFESDYPDYWWFAGIRRIDWPVKN